MKKLFTIDDFIVAFVSALGYGFGDAISKLLGWPELVCMGVSFVLGLVLQEIISRIAFSEAVQKSPMNRAITYAAVFLIFITAHYISTSKLGVSMLDYLGEQVVSVVGLPILGFFVNMFIRGYRKQKIQNKYGDGSKGYVFDVSDKNIEELNQQNQPVSGDYDADCAVKTRTGIYVGQKYKDTIIHAGIPYAKPPVGARRWKAPEPLPSSDAVFEAKYFGASAIQVEHKGVILKHHRQSEDCLTINICSGAKKAEGKKPVLVLFHHGDFTYGGSADPLLYGYNYVSKHPDIVLVSFNYRLGIFGFIDFSDVPGGETYPDALNLGLLDQIAALKWIKENIAAFGGDPDRVTVLGCESGATSICMLAASGQAKDLFGKACVFNGSSETAYDTPDASRALAKNLLKETKTATMEELLKLSTESLKDAAQRLWLNMCAPTCDGTLFPIDVYRAFQEGAASGIEFIIGIPGNETGVFRSYFGNQNYETLVSAGMVNILNYLDNSLSDEIQAYIEKQKSVVGELDAKSKVLEQLLGLYIYRTANKLSEGGNIVHLFYWDEKPLIENLGSGTVDALAAFLGNGEALEMYGNLMNSDLSETLQSLLQKFVKGDDLKLYHNEIKGVDALEWKAFPHALIVSDNKFQCDIVADRITEIKSLYDIMVN